MRWRARLSAALVLAACSPAENAREAAPARAAGDSAGAAPVATHEADACIAFPQDAWTPAPVGAATFIVNAGTRGMAARVRWVLAPDSSAMIAVEDPVGTENDAIPDGVLYATERTGRSWRMDSVWSVSPSPDWRRVAVGRAVVLGGGASQVVAPERWAAPAARLRAIAGAHPSLVAESLQAHSFPVSGMAVVEGAAATFVADVARDEREAPMQFVSLDGWRVRWSCDGRDLLIGTRLARVQDNSPSAAERRVSVDHRAVSTAPPAATMHWVVGPTLDISTLVARGSRRLVVRGRVIEERAGRIIARDSAANSHERDIGPGVPLAATRNGRFVLAIAPRKDAKRYESPDQAVVYRVP